MEKITTITQSENDKVYSLCLGPGAGFLRHEDKLRLAEELGGILTRRFGMLRLSPWLQYFVYRSLYPTYWSFPKTIIQLGVFEWTGFGMESKDKSILERVQPSLEELIRNRFIPRKG